MNYLGIDYGHKKVGVAIAINSSVALPLLILKNSDSLLEEIISIAKKNNIKKIIVGQSIDLDGNENRIMSQINEFAKDMQKNGFDVHMQDERFTTQEAKTLKGEITNVGKSRKKKQIKNVDANAAAIILQNFIDEHKSSC